jgi:arylsulfatase A-like enzyme
MSQRRGRLAEAIRLIAVVLIAVATQTEGPGAQQQGSPRARSGAPNVLFVVFDDLNDWTGPTQGHPQAQTPALDSVARRGANFKSAHVQAPLCNPSRASFLSGLRPSTTGIYALQPSVRTALANYPQLRDHVTLPGYFTQRGYQTITIGKIFHVLEPEFRQREFQKWIEVERGARPSARVAGGVLPPETPENLATVMDWGPFPQRDEDHGDYKVADAAIEQIRTMPRDRPFFLAVGFSLPHVPIFAPQKWFDRIPAGKAIVPPLKSGDRADTPPFSWNLHWILPEPRLSWYEKFKEEEPFVRAYLAGTSFVDAQFGRVLAALEEAGLDDNTIVVAFGDHGYHLGEKEISGKNTLWERSTRVPLVIAGPGVPRRDVEDPVELLDLYPTLVELTSLPAHTGLDGQSLVPQMRGTRRTRPAITTANQGNHAIRTSKWRYIRYADGSEELYDHAADPNEWTNLASDASRRGTIRELAQWLPKADRAAVPGSTSRALIRGADGQWLWEGKPIVPSQAVK